MKKVKKWVKLHPKFFDFVLFAAQELGFFFITVYAYNKSFAFFPLESYDSEGWEYLGAFCIGAWVLVVNSLCFIVSFIFETICGLRK